VGGYLVGVELLDINPGVYMGRTLDFVKVEDLFYGLYKSIVFGLIISLTACYHGFYTTGGAEGVGKAATNAVVLGCVLILAFNYFLTSAIL
jgi:phospholipid/cholesterol/gamma-HCH transport system permease protein